MSNSPEKLFKIPSVCSHYVQYRAINVSALPSTPTHLTIILLYRLGQDIPIFAFYASLNSSVSSIEFLFTL